MAVRFNQAQIEARAAGITLKGLQKAGNAVRDTAIYLIENSPRSGRSYGGVRTSAPGEAPASQTGRLVRSFRVEVHRENYTVSIRNNAPYAHMLEFGTIKMAPRPYLRPALNFIREQTGMLVQSEFKVGF